MVAGMTLAREIASQGPLREVILKELKPGPETQGREQLEADLRRRLMLIYHPVGTARMSDTHEQAVVDSQLRVHGLEGLRVVDASIMPTIVGGNTNAPTIMIAERAADLIRGPRVSVAINYHRTGSGPPLVLLHGVGHHWQAWEPVIERLAGGVRRDRLRHARVRPLGAPARGGDADDPRLRRRVRVVLRRARPRAPPRGRQLDGRRPGAGAGPRPGRELRHGVLADRLLDPRRACATAASRWCSSASPRAPLRAPMAALARTELGRRMLFGQTFGYPAAAAGRGGRGDAARPWAAPALQAHAGAPSRSTASTPPSSCAARP